MQQQPKVQEQITVERVIVDARVTDGNGNAIRDLKASDFRVRIDGKPAVVESADWIADTAAQREIDETLAPETTSTPAPASAPQSRGRPLLLFFSTAFPR